MTTQSGTLAYPDVAGWRPTLADIRNGRRLSAAARFAAERARIWGA